MVGVVGGRVGEWVDVVGVVGGLGVGSRVERQVKVGLANDY